MRFTRLRRAIEDGTLIDTHGKQFQKCTDKVIEAQKKRKKALIEDGDCDGDDIEYARTPSRKRILRSPSGQEEAKYYDPCKADDRDFSQSGGSQMDPMSGTDNQMTVSPNKSPQIKAAGDFHTNTESDIYFGRKAAGVF